MSQPRDDRQDDLFRPEEIIKPSDPLVLRLAGEIDWDFLAGRFSSVCRVGAGQPPLPTPRSFAASSVTFAARSRAQRFSVIASTMIRPSSATCSAVFGFPLVLSRRGAELFL